MSILVHLCEKMIDTSNKGLPDLLVYDSQKKYP